MAGVSTDHRLALIRRHFLGRTDRLSALAPWGKPCPIAAGVLDELLLAHLTADAPPVEAVFERKGKAPETRHGRFRLGSYAPAPDGTTPWVCIDLDGKGHAAALADPLAVATAVVQRAGDVGVPTYLEKSGGGFGWHVWIFLAPGVLAVDARNLAFALLPAEAPLATGEASDAHAGRGVEVFPKSNRVGAGGVGTAVWLPWWHEAAGDANQFFQQGVPFEPETFRTVGAAEVKRVVGDLVSAGTPSASAAAGREHRVRGPDPEWTAWRRRALDALPLDAVYGRYLTGRRSGEGWLECRDPESPTGDRTPSAGVADGTGEAERGTFSSRVSGQSMSVFDFMMRRGEATDFADARRRVELLSAVPFTSPIVVRGVEAPAQAALEPPPQVAPRPGQRAPIQVNERQFREVIADAWTAVLDSNDRPDIFLRGSNLVRTKESHGSVALQDLDETTMFGHLVRIADWVRINEGSAFDAKPDKDLARDLLANPSPGLPPIEAVVHTPVFGRDGQLIERPGYHRNGRLWLEPALGLQMDAVPPHPTNAQVAAARALLLDDALVDFPFVSESDRAHALVALLLPVARRLIDGCTPLHLIEAPSPGSGKGLLANVVGIVTMGAPCHGRTIPRGDDEVRKMLTSELQLGRQIVLLDNLPEKVVIDSASLASILTSDVWDDRQLGATRIITAVNRAAWLATGNNPRLSGELARRCIRIRLNPGVDRPWKRTEFKRSDLGQWVRDQRGPLLHAALVLVQAWVAAGRPLGSKTLGSFERWARVMGGILDVAAVPGFLEGLDELYDAADSEGQAWRQFAAAWWDACGSDPVTPSRLLEVCQANVLMTEVRGDGTPHSQVSRLGRRLQSARDRVFGAYRVVQVRDDRRDGRLYRLEEVASRDRAAEIGDSKGGSGLGREAKQTAPVGGDMGDMGGDVPPLCPPHQRTETTGDFDEGGTWGDIEPGYARGQGRADAHAHTQAQAQRPPKCPPMSPMSPTAENHDEFEGGHQGGLRSPKSPTPSAAPEPLTAAPGLIDLAQLPGEDGPVRPPVPHAPRARPQTNTDLEEKG